jgi:hypothetical protein
MAKGKVPVMLLMIEGKSMVMVNLRDFVMVKFV